MAALGHSSYHVVGWSDGAISATILAADRPAEVKSLVSFGGNAYFSAEDIDAVWPQPGGTEWLLSFAASFKY